MPVAFVASAGGLVVAYSGRNHFGSETYALLMACLPILPRGGYCGRAREKSVAPLAVLMGVPLLLFGAGPGAWASAVLLVVAGTGFAFQLGLQ
ncbi:hypothetical protein ACFY1V_07370 [Streptomyces sp. NPDC001255]|uniref:hypothetical protein n=1 Tax=Streptomyces sp. NPDC001255 TaxID=3364550 RepID=UPI003676ABDC